MEIEEFLKKYRKEIEAREIIVYIVDECHLLWGDICGYVWGPTDKRIDIPLTNERERQTYYGALDYQSQEFTTKGYPKGESQYTIQFIEHLRSLHKTKRIVIIWDGASYHRSTIVKEYLDEVNLDLMPEKRAVHLIQFAPHAPEQNPVEDIWLKGKTFIRQNFSLASTFADVKRLFLKRVNGKLFNFPANCAFA